MKCVFQMNWRLVPVCAAVGLLFVAGCATSKPAPKNYVVFPTPPDEPRIQYLWSFGSESDLGRRSAFSEFVVGSESIHRPIIKPYGVAIRDGKIYVCDTQAGNVSVSDLKTRKMRYLKPVGQAAFQVPVNVAVDKAGLIYVTDTERGQLMIFNQDAELLEALGKTGEMKPCGLFLTEDKIYITDLKSSSVRVFDKASRKEVLSFPAKDDSDDKRRLFQPTNLTVDGKGRVIVSDTGGFAIKIYDSQGKHLQTVGELGVSPGQFALPKGVGVDREGRLYVLDSATPVIQLFNEQGQLLMYFGLPSSSGPGGLYLPAGLTIDYENVGLFEKFVAPGQQIEYVILVTNQVGPRKVSVYGFLKKK